MLSSKARTPVASPPAVTVHKSARNFVDPGGSVRTPFSDRVAFLRAFFIYGQLFLIQNFGIPTGGPHSTVLLSIVCGHREHLFIKFKWAAIMRSLGLN